MGKRYVQVGDTVIQQLPWSEVCMSMRVADRSMTVQVVGDRYPMAQLIDDNGAPFSFPITLGEAGLYQDAAGIYQTTADPAPSQDQTYVFAGLTAEELETIKRANDAAGVPTLVREHGAWVAV